MRSAGLCAVLCAFLSGMAPAACSDGGSEAVDSGGNGSSDPYEGLMGVAEGEILCKEDSCCFKRCWGNNDTVCVTRDGSALADAVDGAPDCAPLLFPSWFYNHDCFIGTGGIVGPGHPSRAGDPLTYGNSFSAEDQSFLFFVQCFCGRKGSIYASEYSAEMRMSFSNCDSALVPETSLEDFEKLFACDNPCNSCTPSCSGRACGSDGCGGSCAPGCRPGETCTTTGQCTSGSQQDPCSACLSTCRGLPSCCMGCGCLCEDECGGCF